MTTLVTEPLDQLRRIADLAGLDSDLLRQPGVRRWIDRRAAALDLSIAAYQDRLLRVESERRLLSEQVAVPESWVNRYPASFELLRARAVASRPGDGTFRVVSLGCASGQEPFTVAATLLDAGLSRDRVEIIAVDRSRAAIDAARSGLLPSMAIRDEIPPSLQARFERDGSGWRVDPEVHSTVDFVEADIVTDPLPVSPASCDVVLCRNVLIYLAAEPRRRLSVRAAGFLKPDGVLLAGHADPPADLGIALESIDLPGGFAWRAITGDRPARDARTSIDRPLRRPVATTRFPVLDSKPARPREADASDAASVRRLAEVGRIEEARAVGEALVDRRPDDIETRMLLARIEREDGRFDVAREHLRRLLYLEPENAEALSEMVSLAEAEGDVAAAIRHQRRLERINNDSGEASS